jgi:hypothetical protein
MIDYICTESTDLPGGWSEAIRTCCSCCCRFVARPRGPIAPPGRLCLSEEKCPDADWGKVGRLTAAHLRVRLEVLQQEWRGLIQPGGGSVCWC